MDYFDVGFVAFNIKKPTKMMHAFISGVHRKHRYGEQEKSKDYILRTYESQLMRVYVVFSSFVQEDHAHLA